MKPMPGVAEPSAALARTVLEKLVSRKETVPVGGAEPPLPWTMAVSE